MSGPDALRVVVLAAGASSRLGQPKALAELGGRPAIDHLLESVRGLAPASRPIVVTGRHHAEIAAHLAGANVIVARCRNWEAGRIESLRCGAREAGGAGLLVAPMDCPLVGAATFLALRDAWSEAGAPQAGWLAPFVSEDGGPARRFGHPIVLGPELVRALDWWGGDRSLRDLRAQASPLFGIETADESILDDLDTPADLASLRARVERRPR